MFKYDQIYINLDNVNLIRSGSSMLKADTYIEILFKDGTKEQIGIYNLNHEHFQECLEKYLKER